MKDFLKKNFIEFKTFAMRGNVIDMAVGIIIGTAFGKVVSSMVDDVIMPPLGWVLGKVDFSSLFIALPTKSGFKIYESLSAAKMAGAATINYGVFINSLINFIIVAFAVFLLIKAVNKLQAAAKLSCENKEPECTTKECPRCFSTIDIKATKCPHCTADID